MKVHDSARKHGAEPDDAVHAAEHALIVSDLDEDNPARQVRLGFDTDGRRLEVVVLRFDSGNGLLIHAMTARRHTATFSVDPSSSSGPRHDRTAAAHAICGNRGRSEAGS